MQEAASGMGIRAYVIVALAGLATYSVVLGHDFIALDDDILVTQNPAVHEISTDSVQWVFTHFDPELYIPLTFVSYQADYAIGNGSAFPFHATNLFLHTLNALLVATLAFTLTKRRFVALLCGLLFAVHPLNAEAVAWVSARKDLLSTTFFLLATLSYMRHRRTWYVLSLTLFVLGLLSKVMVLTLPAVLVLIDLYTNRRHDKWLIIDKIPYALLAGIFGAVALLGKQGVIDRGTPMEGVLLAIKATMFYLQKLFWPSNLSVVYPYTDTISALSADFFLPAIALAACAFLLYQFHRRGYDVLFGIFFFLVTLAPTFLTPWKAGDVYFASDRYAYVPAIGIFLIVALIIERQDSRVLRRAALIAIAILAVVAHMRAGMWQNTGTLFLQDVATYPNSHLAQNKAGSVLWQGGYKAEAEAHFRASIAIQPTARALYNLGLVSLDKGELRDALDQNQSAIALEPTYAPARMNAGYVLWKLDRKEEARAQFQEVLRLEPQSIDVRLNLAAMAIEEKNAAETERLLQEILAIDPTNAEAVQLLGLIT